MAGRAKRSAAVEAASKGRDGQSSAAPFADYAAVVALGSANLAAMLRASAVLSEGLEAIGEEVMNGTRASLENVAGTAAALLGARTLEQVVQLNAALFKRLVERSTKLSEMGAKVAAETLAPLGSQVEATVEKLGSPFGA